MAQKSEYVSKFALSSKVIKSLHPLFHKALKRLEAFLAWGLHMGWLFTNELNQQSN
jgi:hypothetical protein